ncbi:MAG: cache domain-containing protein [Clostridiaceae bacterium]|nr:cache domain-containing protein [Clostridiaceae bacterium]
MFINETINAVSEMNMSYINEAYIGGYEIINNKLYKGENPLEGNNNLVDKVFQQTGASASILRMDTRVATTIKDSKDSRLNGTKVSGKVADIILKQGKNFLGETSIDANTYISKYIPIRDKDNKVIGMWFVGVDKSVITKTIEGIDLIILLVTLVVIMVAYLAINIFVNRILKNFNKLISSLDIISSGDLATKCSVNTND